MGILDCKPKNFFDPDSKKIISLVRHKLVKKSTKPEEEQQNENDANEKEKIIKLDIEETQENEPQEELQETFDEENEEKKTETEKEENQQIPQKEESLPKPTSSNEFDIIFCDPSYEKYFCSKVNLRIISSLRGISELSVDNNLYLCGAEPESNTGSYLIQIDNSKGIKSTISILINSPHVHQYPSMIYLPNKYILVVGGKSSINCEAFDKNTSKWRFMPELPEERYGSSLVVDGEGSFVYLFGGYASETKSNANTLLRMNLKSFIIWEKMMIVEGSQLLARRFCACYSESEKIYLIGGEKARGELCDDIVVYNTKTRKASVVKDFHLKHKAKFRCQKGVDICSNKIAFMDKTMQMHIINKSEINMFS